MSIFGSVFAALCFLPWGWRLIKRNCGTAFFLLALVVVFAGRILFYFYSGLGTVRYLLPMVVLFVALAPAGIAGLALVAGKLPLAGSSRFRQWLLRYWGC